jgi:hypothetical protein
LGQQVCFCRTGSQLAAFQHGDANDVTSNEDRGAPVERFQSSNHAIDLQLICPTGDFRNVVSISRCKKYRCASRREAANACLAVIARSVSDEAIHSPLRHGLLVA